MTTDTVVAQRVARAELMKRVLIVAISIIVTAVLIAVLILLRDVRNVIDAVRGTQQSSSPTLTAIKNQQDDIEVAARAATSVNDLILGCFDPKSKCAKRTAAKDAERAGAINAAVIAARFCADQRMPKNYTLHQLTVCVGQIIDKEATP